MSGSDDAGPRPNKGWQPLIKKDTVRAVVAVGEHPSIGCSHGRAELRLESENPFLAISRRRGHRGAFRKSGCSPNRAHVPRMPLFSACRRISSVDPFGNILAKSGPLADATRTTKTLPRFGYHPTAWSKPDSREEFLRRFPLSVEQGKVALSLFEEAYRTQNAEDSQCALIIGAAFGFGPEHTDVLCRLVEADWHFSHEDVVSALDELRTPAAVGALFRATQWMPEYLNFDESRALASKAIWALGKISCSQAEEKLEALTRSDDPDLREKAMGQLQRRHKRA